MEKRDFSIQGKRAVLYSCGESGCPLIVLNSYADDGENVHRILIEIGASAFDLLVVSALNWDHDMTPWACPPVFSGGPAYSGGADEYLALLTEQILPKAKAMLSGVPAFTGIAGYSLAGLFALYALYRCDVFDRAASMSGSLWYPDFLKFAAEHEPGKKPERICLSVGDKEAKTKNPLLKTVQENTEAITALYRSRGIDVSFELNPGNHFRDPDLRTAKGIKAILR